MPSLADRADAEASRPLLETRNLVKDFAGVRAVDHVSIDVHAGEVLGLVGENGAGKSTVTKMIAGLYRPDGGEIVWRGEAVPHTTPAHAIQAGIELIPQELSIGPNLSVAENVMIGRYPSRAGVVSRRLLRGAASELLSRVGLDVDVRRAAGSLTPAEQRLVMIARALSRDVRLMIMDEPTAALQGDDVETLLGLVGALRADGVSTIYVSHRLDEVLRISDRISVMRDGELVTTEDTGTLDKPSIMNLIVGRRFGAQFPDRHNTSKPEPLLRVRGLTGGGAHDISFDVGSGEILGIAGLVGSRRTEVVRRLFGADRADEVTVTLDGEDVDIRRPKDAIRLGMALLPEDRRHQGILPTMSVTNNVTLPSLQRFSTWGGYVRRRAEAKAVDASVAELNIVTSSQKKELRHLSGGNQQKVLIAKWLMTKPRLLIFDEPTVGIDVGAKREIYELIVQLAESGSGVIVISSDFEEIVGLCGRVIVLREGSMVGELHGEAITEKAILDLCFVNAHEEEVAS